MLAATSTLLADGALPAAEPKPTKQRPDVPHSMPASERQRSQPHSFGGAHLTAEADVTRRNLCCNRWDTIAQHWLWNHLAPLEWLMLHKSRKSFFLRKRTGWDSKGAQLSCPSESSEAEKMADVILGFTCIHYSFQTE